MGRLQPFQVFKHRRFQWEFEPSVTLVGPDYDYAGLGETGTFEQRHVRQSQSVVHAEQNERCPKWRLDGAEQCDLVVRERHPLLGFFLRKTKSRQSDAYQCRGIAD